MMKNQEIVFFIYSIMVNSLTRVINKISPKETNTKSIEKTC